MKGTRIINIILALVMIVGGVMGNTQAARAASTHVLTLKNASFETSNVYGWDKTLPSAGAAATATTSYAFTDLVVPKYGQYMAVLFPDLPGQYTRLSQTITATDGDIISGWANFCSRDYAPYNDDGQVVIKNSSGIELSTLFTANSATLGSGVQTGWTYWQYQFTAPGINTYIIEARVQNIQDNYNASVMCIDGVNTNTPVSADAGGISGKYYVNQGNTIQLNGSATDPTGGEVDYSWDLDNNGTFETIGQNPLFSAVDLTAPLTQTVTIKATNSYYDPLSTDPKNDNYIAIATAQVIVGSTLFTVGISTVDPTPISPGSTFQGLGSIRNPSGSIYTLTVDYGDGSGLQPLTYDSNYGFVLNHIYTTAGSFNITVIAVDVTRGGTASATVIVNVQIPVTYRLTSNVSGQGTITTDKAGPDYLIGTVVQLTAVPADSTWNFDHWTGDLSGDSNPVELIIDGNKSVGAVFTSNIGFTLNVLPSDNGAVTVEPVMTSFPAGTSITLTATPANGYQFSAWTGDITSGGTPLTFEITQNMTVSASFTPTITYTLNLPVVGHGTAVVTNPPGQTQFLPGTTVTVQGTPSNDSVFNGWSGDLVSTDNPLTFIVNANISISANFSASSTYALNVTNDGNGSVSVDPQQDSYTFGTEITLTPEPVIGSSFTGWTGFFNGTTSPLIFQITGDTNITAHFAVDNYSLDITVIDDTGLCEVAVSPEPSSSGTFVYGTEVTLTAQPSTGSVFSGWEGDLSGNANPATITMNSYQSVTANFSLIQINITSDAGNNGTIDPSGTTQVGYGNDQEFTITPAQGYQIENVVLDGQSILQDVAIADDGSGTYTLANITAEHSISASFEKHDFTFDLTTLTNPSVLGEDVIYDATLTGVPSIGNPTGTLQFTLDSVNYGDPVELIDGKASITLTNLTVGNHLVGAVYNGDNNYVNKNVEVTDTVSPAATVLALSASPASPVYLQQVNFTAVVSSSIGVPTGNVQFTVDGAPFGSPVSLDNGSAVSGYTALTAGPHTITANFTDSTDYANCSHTLELSVEKVTPEFSNLSNLTIPGGTATATVGGTINAGSLVASGNVNITLKEFSQLAEIQTDGTFSAIFNTSALNPLEGPYIINYSFAENSNFNSATGVGNVSVTIKPLVIPAILWANPADIVYRTALSGLQLNASLTDTSIAGVFTYTPALDTILSAGANQPLNVTFVPADPSSYTDATAQVFINVTKAAPVFSNLTSASVALGAASATLGGTISSVPAGTLVTITLDGVSQTASVLANGTFSAAFSTSTLTAGTYSITYAFTGGDNFSAVSGTGTLTVNASAVLYSLCLRYDYCKGTVTLSPQPTNGKYAEGTVVTITATPKTGYTFTGWSGDLNGTSNPATITMSGNKTVTAAFARPTTGNFNLNLNSQGYGYITANPNLCKYTAGTVVTLRATPRSGYTFTGWSGDLTGTANPATITMNSDKNVTAIFTRVASGTYELSIHTQGYGYVSTSPSQCKYTAGTVVTLTAKPKSGYTFTGWSGSLSGTANPITVTMTSDKNVTAIFSRSNSGGYELDLDTRGHGSISASPNQERYSNGTVVTLTASAKSGYVFTGWSGDLTGTANPATITMSGNKSVRANFSANTTSTYNLDLNYDSHKGSVTLSPNSRYNKYAAGTVVTLTASAKSGYKFSGWSGDLTGTANPGTITMSGNKSVNASFTLATPNSQNTNFVIWGGNKANLTDAIKVGQTFTCWGSQWEKQVTSGNYSKNAAFKGWANQVSADGKSWTTAPGNSSNPPSQIGQYISVLVSTNIAKKGSTISGNIVATVLLEVSNPGSYQSDPGHPITGKVVSITLK